MLNQHPLGSSLVIKFLILKWLVWKCGEIVLETNTYDLNVEPIDEQEKSSVRWFQHIQSINESHSPKIILNVDSIKYDLNFDRENELNRESQDLALE